MLVLLFGLPAYRFGGFQCHERLAGSPTQIYVGQSTAQVPRVASNFVAEESPEDAAAHRTTKAHPSSWSFLPAARTAGHLGRVDLANCSFVLIAVGSASKYMQLSSPRAPNNQAALTRERSFVGSVIDKQIPGRPSSPKQQGATP